MKFMGFHVRGISNDFTIRSFSRIVESSCMLTPHDLVCWGGYEQVAFFFVKFNCRHEENPQTELTNKNDFTCSTNNRKMTTQNTNRSYFYFQSYLENTSIYNVNSSIGQSPKKVPFRGQLHCYICYTPIVRCQETVRPLRSTPYVHNLRCQSSVDVDIAGSHSLSKTHTLRDMSPFVFVKKNHPAKGSKLAFSQLPPGFR